MRRKLPVLVEHSVQGATSARVDVADEFERKVRAQGTVSCSKGCNHCCYHPVLISILEGISIFRWLDERRLWTKALQAKFSEAQSKTWGLSLDVWLLAMIPCPLLTSEGTCGAYEARPLSCRATFSVGDPYYCHPHRVSEAGGIPSRRGVFLSAGRSEATYLKPHGLKYMRFPLAAAMLIAEKVVRGDIDLGDLAGTMGPEKLNA